MPRGRPPKSAAAKLAAGNAGHRPIKPDEPPVPLVAAAPPKPDLSPGASAIWDEVAPQLVAAGLLAPVDGVLFGEYCESAADVIHYRAKVRKAENRRNVDSVGKAREIGDSKCLESAVKQADKLGALFGVTPKSRQSLGVKLDKPRPPANAAQSKKDRILGR